MKVVDFLNIIKNKTYQNASPVFYTDAEYIHDINGGLTYIFNYLNSYINWYYSIGVDTFDLSTETNIFDLTYGINNIYRVRVNNDRNLKYRKVFFEPDDDYFYRISGEKQIKTANKFKNLEIIYKREPKIADVGSQEEDLDLPKALESVLEFYIMSRVMMPLPDGGRNIANNDLNYANVMLDNYANNIGHLSEMEEFNN